MCIAEFFGLRSRLLILIWHLPGSDWIFFLLFSLLIEPTQTWNLLLMGVCNLFWRRTVIIYILTSLFKNSYTILIIFFLLLQVSQIFHTSIPTQILVLFISSLSFFLPLSLWQKTAKQNKPKDKNCPIIRKEFHSHNGMYVCTFLSSHTVIFKVKNGNIPI